jgi:hypothetical protein
MKRPIKPFVVEVRKGQKAQTKKAPVVELPPLALFEEQPRENDALRRAEAALFGVFAAKPDPSAPSSRSGRILESLPDEAPSVEAPQIEGKRRGRPPGSRNKPKEDGPEPVAIAADAPTAPKRRGRPPRVLEGSVRKVELTPELASAALESIAKASVMRAPVPTRPAPKGRDPLAPPKPPREPKRALRKEKLIKAKASKEKVVKVKAIKVKAIKEKVFKAKAIKEKAPAVARHPRRPVENAAIPASAAPMIWPEKPLDTLPRLIRIAVEKAQDDPVLLLSALRRPRAGERWKRRLRGASMIAYERRLRKTDATPR